MPALISAKLHVNSSSLNWFSYEAETSTLDVNFSSGITYRYDNVTNEMFKKLANAESYGKALNTIIKQNDKVGYVRLEEELATV